MSYSFTARAGSRAVVLEKVAAEFDTIVSNQPIHAKDRDQMIAAVKAFLELLPEAQAGHEIQASIHGSLGWKHKAQDAITNATVGISISLVDASV